MNLDSKLTVGSQVMSREVSGETVLLDLASGVYFGIDEVGTFIWAGLTAGRSLREIVDGIVADFDVERAVAERDVVAFVENLQRNGLIEVAG